MSEMNDKWSRKVGGMVNTLLSGMRTDPKFLEFKKFFPNDDPIDVYSKYLESTKFSDESIRGGR